MTRRQRNAPVQLIPSDRELAMIADLREWWGERHNSNVIRESLQAGMVAGEGEAGAGTAGGGGGEMKVYGVSTYLRGIEKQVRVIVAALSEKAAAAAIGISLYYMRTYGSDTGNTKEIAAAMSKPGAVFYKRTNAGESEPYREYVKQEAQ